LKKINVAEPNYNWALRLLTSVGSPQTTGQAPCAIFAGTVFCFIEKCVYLLDLGMGNEND